MSVTVVLGYWAGFDVNTALDTPEEAAPVVSALLVEDLAPVRT
jgi:hypothetical protein